MSYFSRLTDIVTCNLSQLLSEAPDPHAAIADIIREMDEGLAGAQRSVKTAAASEQKLQREIDEHRAAVVSWTSKAKEQLGAGNESEARQSLLRKREVEDLIAGLEQQHKAAIATRQHLATMQRALEARLSEAFRKRDELGATTEVVAAVASPPANAASPKPAEMDERQRQIDAELEALKRELGN